MHPITELRQGDAWMGLACTECSLAFIDKKAVNRVRLADAELLFCPRCGQHLASILDHGEQKLAKSA